MRFADLAAPPAPAWQNLNEFGHLWDAVADIGASKVLEIGSLYGGTLWYWSKLPFVDLVVSVDRLAEQEPMRTEVGETRKLWASWFEGREFVHFDADSHLDSVVEDVGVGSPFDFAFIDGDHGYHGIKMDWQNYSPMVRSGGIVAFHDTWPSPRSHEPGVVAWIEELRHQMPVTEWTDPDGVGIAMVVMP